jgi:hypothetical protein
MTRLGTVGVLQIRTLRYAAAAAFALVLGLGSPAASAQAKLPPLRDPVFLNIGFVCQWRDGCISRQRTAMKKALAYVDKNDPPAWKVQQCNRNASRYRGRGRVDWIGFNNCIRNKSIRPAVRRRR